MPDRKPLGIRIGVGLIRIYQKSIRWKPPSCRYTPTCSNYTLQAIEEYGFWIGSWMGIKRISRCHPFRPGGHDPVPKRNESSSKPEK